MLTDALSVCLTIELPPKTKSYISLCAWATAKRENKIKYIQPSSSFSFFLCLLFYIFLILYIHDANFKWNEMKWEKKKYIKLNTHTSKAKKHFCVPNYTSVYWTCWFFVVYSFYCECGVVFALHTTTKLNLFVVLNYTMFEIWSRKRIFLVQILVTI